MTSCEKLLNGVCVQLTLPLRSRTRFFTVLIPDDSQTASVNREDINQPAHAQAELSLTGSHMTKCTFSRHATQYDFLSTLDAPSVLSKSLGALNRFLRNMKA